MLASRKYSARRRKVSRWLGHVSLLFALVGSDPVLAQEIIVGQTLSLTGPSAAMAQGLLRGREACTEFVNSQGGIRGLRLRLVTRDDQGDPAQAVKLHKELALQEGTMVLLGSMGPAVNTVVLAWAGIEGLAVVAPQGGDVENRTRGADTAFFLTANQSAEAEQLATHIASLGLRRVVIVHSTDRAGRAALTALEEGLGVTNVAAIALVPVQQDGKDALQASQSVTRAGAQAVLLATSGRTTMAMLQALTASSAGAMPVLQVYGLSSAASQAELIALGQRARGFAMTQVMPLPRGTRVPVVQTFQTALRRAGGERTYAELEGCMAPLLLAEVLRRRPALPASRASILSALRTAGRVDLGGFELDLSDRAKPGSRFTDIVYVGPDGRIVH